MTQEEWADSIQWIFMVAGCVIQKDGKYLMVQEKRPKVYGKWNMPAGHVDKGEAAEAAAVREAKEETGLEVSLDGLIDLYHDGGTESLKHAYRAHIVGGELHIKEDEVLDAKWLTYEEIQQLNNEDKIREPWIFDAITQVHINQAA